MGKEKKRMKKKRLKKRKNKQKEKKQKRKQTKKNADSWNVVKMPKFLYSDLYSDLLLY